MQLPNDHLQGKGCKKCFNLSQEMSLENWKTHCNNLHKSTYDYSLILTIKSKQKVLIVCKQHGEFSQREDMHKIGQGCPTCATQNNGYSKTTFFKRCVKNNNIGLFYIIKCWNEHEEFYKVGICSTKISKRYTKNCMPYNYEVIQQITSQSENIWELELFFKNYILKNNLIYFPNVPFNGSKTECYKF